MAAVVLDRGGQFSSQMMNGDGVDGQKAQFGREFKLLLIMPDDHWQKIITSDCPDISAYML